MNKEEYTAKFNLEINDYIARLTSKIDDEICEVWKIDKKDILETLNFKENLIKYIEDKIKDYKTQFSQINGDYGLLNPVIMAYLDVLERIKNVTTNKNM